MWANLSQNPALLLSTSKFVENNQPINQSISIYWSSTISLCLTAPVMKGSFSGKSWKKTIHRPNLKTKINDFFRNNSLDCVKGGSFDGSSWFQYQNENELQPMWGTFWETQYPKVSQTCKLFHFGTGNGVEHPKKPIYATSSSQKSADPP